MKPSPVKFDPKYVNGATRTHSYPDLEVYELDMKLKRPTVEGYGSDVADNAAVYLTSSDESYVGGKKVPKESILTEVSFPNRKGWLVEMAARTGRYALGVVIAKNK